MFSHHPLTIPTSVFYRLSILLILFIYPYHSLSAKSLKFCTYNLKIKYGETFNIRDFIQYSDGSAITDWSQVELSYESATTPLDWHLIEFTAGQDVTVIASDAANNTGNVGQGRFRIVVKEAGNANKDDTMTIRVSSDKSNLTTASCSQQAQLANCGSPIF